MTKIDLEDYYEATRNKRGEEFTRKDLINMLIVGVILPIGIIFLIGISIKLIIKRYKK